MEFNKENNSIIIGRIIARSVNGAVTPAEQAVLDDWLQDDGNRQIYEAIRNGHPVGDALSAFDGFDAGEGYQYFQASIRRNKSVRYRVWMAAAAAVLVFLAVSVTLYLNSQKESQPAGLTSVYSNDVAPGGNRATLTLADGRSIDLSSSHEGIIVDDEITYVDGSAVMDGRPETGDRRRETGEGRREGNTSESLLRTPGSGLLTLTTPRGGQYQVTLPDGTEVWLNSASTLKYPARFNGVERVVEIDGEGYFSVTHDKRRPFRVLSKGQVVEVLGTEFNISAYSDEPEIKTTLVGGSVRVAPTAGRSSTTIKPGQQSKLKNGDISVDDVNVDPYIAWKKGMFHFKQIPFVDMMRQIERWYDVEIVYNSRIPLETFSGRMRRDVSLMTVLDLLKVSEISYHLNGNKLIIE